MNKLLNAAEFPALIVSGIIGQKIGAKLWKQIVGSEPPDTAQEDARWADLLAAAVLEGTLWKLIRMVLDRSLRVAVARSTGSWPGEPGQGE